MSAQRMQFFSMAALILIGIWLSGFGQVHWFLYLPPLFLFFAGATGVCPGLIFWRRLGFK